MSTKKYVAYYRVSSKQQGESGLGLADQRKVVEHYASIDGNVVADFTDVASGTGMEGRQGLKDAMNMCLQNGYTLIVAKTDRLARNTKLAITLADQLVDANGNALLYCIDCPSSNGTTDSFTLNLFFLFAQREAELISMRTKAGLAQSKKAKGTNGHKNRDTAEYKAKRKKAAQAGSNARSQQTRDKNRVYANVAYRMVQEGYLLKEIAAELNQRELDKVAEKENEAVFNYKPRRFTPKSVSRLLKYSDVMWEEAQAEKAAA